MTAEALRPWGCAQMQAVRAHVAAGGGAVGGSCGQGSGEDVVGQVPVV